MLETWHNSIGVPDDYVSYITLFYPLSFAVLLIATVTTFLRQQRYMISLVYIEVSHPHNKEDAHIPIQAVYRESTSHRTLPNYRDCIWCTHVWLSVMLPTLLSLSTLSAGNSDRIKIVDIVRSLLQ